MAFIVSDSANPKYGTGVATVAVANGGSGYAVNDVLTLTGGDANATCTVLTVDGSGAVLTVSRTAVGSGYSAGTESTTVAPAGGSACTITITVGAGLSTVNGFYRAEAWNAGIYNPSYLQISTEKTIAVTFANAGNCQGIILAIMLNSNANDSSVTVKLQEYVGSTWTDRATTTYNAAQISSSAVGQRRGVYFVPFTGGTFPYAVDATASKWRFSVLASGGSDATSTYMATSNGTAAFYVTWCDTQISHNNNDTMIVKDAVVIDKSATFNGILGTGETTVPTAIWICRTLTPAIDTVALLTWENPAQASYTLTMNGCFTISTHGGLRVGTSTDPIKSDVPAKFEFPSSPYAGGVVIRNSGNSSMSYNWGKHSIFLYGEYPSVMRTTLSQDELALQNVIHTTDTTGWAIGDALSIGKIDTVASNSKIFYIQSITGKTITLTENIDIKRLSGGLVIKHMGSGFGIRFQETNTKAILFSNCDQNIEIRGVSFRHCAIGFTDHTYCLTNDIAANTTAAPFVDYCGIVCTTRGAASFFTGVIPVNGFRVEKCNIGMTSGWNLQANVYPTWSSGYFKMWDCRVVDYSSGSTGWNAFFTSLEPDLKLDIQDNVFENGHWSGCINLGGVNPILKNNTFWNISSSLAGSYGAVTIHNCFNPTISGNRIDRCTVGLEIGPYTTVGCIGDGFIFGSTTANTLDVNVQPYAFVDFQLKDPVGLATSSFTNMTTSVSGSKFSIVNATGANEHKNYLTNGMIFSTGDGLADTTVHTSGTGKFAVRFESTSSTSPHTWSFFTPTGNIQNKTMTVGVWCKINNATYYAGTHQLPRLTINYDNGTTTYTQATASTDWQYLPVNFTPITTYGQITVTLSTMTDATGSNAYVYFDDFSVLYPAGYKLDLGGMDLWANGLPVTPPIATVLSANDVWSASTVTEYGTDTQGEKLKSLKNASLIIDGEIIV